MIGARGRLEGGEGAGVGDGAGRGWMGEAARRRRPQRDIEEESLSRRLWPPGGHIDLDYVDALLIALM